MTREITLAHVRGVVFGEEFARQGITRAIDFLLRSVEVRPTVWMMVTQGEAREFMQTRPIQEMVPVEGPIGYHDAVQSRTGTIPARRLAEVANILQEEGIDLVLPLFRRADQPPPKANGALHPTGESKEIIFGGAGVFRQGRLVAWLSPEEVRGLLWTTERLAAAVLTAPCEGAAQQAVFRIRKSDGRMRVNLEQGRLQVTIQVRAVADLNELTCEEVIVGGRPGDLENLLAGQVREEIQEAIAVVRETRSDFFGFGQELHRRNALVYNTNARRWEELLERMSVEVVVDPTVPRTGQMLERYRGR